MEEQIWLLKNAIQEGHPTDVFEEEIAKGINNAKNLQPLFDLGLETMKKIIAKNENLNINAIASIIKHCGSKYGDVGISILRYIKMDKIEEDDIMKILNFLGSIPIMNKAEEIILKLRRIIKENDNKYVKYDEDGYIEVDWEGENKALLREKEILEKEVEKLKIDMSDMKEVLELKEKCGGILSKEEKITEFIKASGKGFVGVVKYFISQGVDVNSEDIWNNHTNALIEASANGRLDVVKYLISQRANINNKNSNQDDALTAASSNGHVDVIDFLFSNGAHLNENALIKACTNGHLMAVKYLISRGAVASQDALLAACEGGNLEVVKYLISNGADVRAKDYSGNTALIKACESGQFSVVDYFVSHGANVNEKNTYGQTPLMKACKIGNLRIVKYLIQHGANRDDRDNEGRTAFVLACAKGDYEVIEYLYPRGGNNENDIGLGLIEASGNGHLNIVEFLRRRGASVRTKDKKGQTALMKASRGGHFEIVKFLISEGADVREKDNDYGTAYVYSRTNEIREYLVRCGAQTSEQSEYDYKNPKVMTGIRYSKKKSGVVPIDKWKFKNMNGRIDPYSVSPF